MPQKITVDVKFQICIIKFKYIRGLSRLGYYFWVSNGKRNFLDNFTCLVCLDCIVKHILDHTYISYSISSTPTKLI